MRFSLMTSVVALEGGSRHWDLDGYLSDCRLAEELGYFAVYKGERRGQGLASGQHGAVNSATLLGSYVLAHTRTLVFGTDIVILPLYHPTILIQDATMVNAMYGGRFRLGVGAGYSEDDLAVTGVVRRERVAYMKAGLDAFDAYRNGRSHSLEGGPWKGEVPIPDPAMGEHRPEILVGAWTPAGARLSALGDAWSSGPISRVEQLQHLAEIYREACGAEGKQARVVVMRDGCIGESREEALALAANVLDYHRIYFARGRAYDARWERQLNGITDATALTLEMVLEDRVLCGTPDDWVAQLTAWQARLGVEEFVIRLGFFLGPSREVVQRQIRLVANEVIPRMAK